MFSIRCNSGVKSLRNQKKSERKTKVKPFINKYNWKEINFSSKNRWLVKIEEDNRAIALNVL